MSYIPSTDVAYLDWQNNFAALLTLDPESYGETAGTALTVQTVADEYADAYLLATDPSTRTAPTVAAKDVAKFTAIATIRPVAIRIRNNSAVTDEQRADLGLTIVKTVPTPIPAPTTFPILGIRKATPLTLQLQYTDSGEPDGKAKPFGAIGVEIWSTVGTEAATDPNQTSFDNSYTKSPLTLNFAAEDQGKIASIFARFVTRAGPGGAAQRGPWSAILTTHIM